ncbi:MAG TPA: hypothetical protein RMF84_21235 [Polyangiaceae bacterium LLY-WYZ-14_1]|nr:hypothetical protein [Polyangiaceae bacterium LLY-WYZ-14_1]
MTESDTSDPLRFAGDWLALREPADRRARDAGGLARRLAQGLAPGDGPLEVWDLGSGTGANVRYLGAHLPADTRFRLLEPDPALRAAVQLPEALRGRAEVRDGDLRDPLRALAQDTSGPPHLATASALFDLGGAVFAEGILDALRPRVWLLALEVDGSLELTPGHPLDEVVRAAFAADQERPKGLGPGPALGPTAPRFLTRALTDRGYRVEEADTPWRLRADRPSDRALLDALLVGLAEPAGPSARPWLARRRGELDAGRLTLTLGHRDLLAWRSP